MVLYIMCNNSKSSYQVCKVKGCSELGHDTGLYRKDGSLIRRTLCYKHHVENCAAKKGLSKRDWQNSFHEYRKYRKTYCENIDSRLGFACTANIVWTGMLQVDHKNGNSNDHRPENLQTLCANCHAYKTNTNKDWQDKPSKVKFKVVA